MIENETVAFFFPLYGLRYEGDALFIGHGAILQFDLFEWQMWEDREIFHEHLDDDLGVENLGTAAATRLGWKNPLPYGVAVVEAYNADADRRQAEAVARDVVFALRLHKEGAFMDPVFFGSYARTSTGRVSRRPGLYRQRAYDRGGDLDDFFREDAYVLEATDRDRVDELATALDASRTAGLVRSTDIAQDNFLFSFAPNLDAHARLALLFTTMEAIFGPFNSTVAGVGFIGRAIAAVHAGGIEPEALHGFLADEAPRWRNTVAHAGPETLPAGADQAVKQASRALRGALRCRVRFFHNVASEPGRDRMTAVLGQPMFAPRKAFNTILAAAVAGDEGARALLYAHLGQVPE